jgi:predicted kinase
MWDPPVATLILMVGLPAAGKTTRAKELAATYRALRLTPDDWMIPLFGESMADGKRFVLEGRLISVALQALRLRTSFVLDYGLWGRDERSALRWLAPATGAACRWCTSRGKRRPARPHRTPPATRPNQTFPMSEADVNGWRKQFQVPDATELHGGEILPARRRAGRIGWNGRSSIRPRATTADPTVLAESSADGRALRGL